MLKMVITGQEEIFRIQQSQQMLQQQQMQSQVQQDLSAAQTEDENQDGGSCVWSDLLGPFQASRLEKLWL